MEAMYQRSIPTSREPLSAAGEAEARPITIEDALALSDPTEVGRTLHEAECADSTEGFDLDLGDSLIETAIWLCGWAPDTDFTEWVKLATGLIAYAQAIGRERAEVHAKLTPFREVYARYQDPEAILKEDEAPFEFASNAK
jgi:hypothetical protein